VRLMTRALLSRWLLVGFGGLFVVLGTSAVRSQQDQMEIRHIRPVDLIGIPYDSNTSVRASDTPELIRADITATFAVTYSGFTPEAQAAFQAAVDVWSNVVTSSVPIQVNAQFTTLGPGVLGSAGPVYLIRNFSGAPQSGTFYSAALGNARAGADLVPTLGDINADFNSAFANWYFGTDGNTPPGQFDFMTVVLHELGHGLGFFGSASVNSGMGSWGVSSGGIISPVAYDRFTVNGALQSLIDTSLFPNPSTALASQLTSNNVFWSGANGIAANGGARPKLYTPGTWQGGSSYSHLDEATYPPGNINSLMTPAIGTREFIGSPGPITTGIFNDIGWTASSVPCTYTLSATSATAAQGGAVGATVNVTANPGCAWTAVSNSPGMITVASGTPGSGNGTVTYNVSANLSTFRAGTMTIAGQTFTVSQNGLGPTMNLDKTSLQFGATTSGTTFVAQTSAQIVRMTQSGAGTVTWTATSTQPWLQVAPASGTGSANLSITVVATPGIPAQGSSLGQINLVLTGAGNAPGPIAVTLTTILTGNSALPTGTTDTPLDNQTNVSGAVPFTGWALDDTEVSMVAVCRAAFGSEVAPIDPNCGGFAQIFIGFAVFIDGARPDVAGSFPTLPRNTRAGWGFMVLTNMLPNQGNGTYVFQMWAHDREGRATVIGTRTMTCNNAAAIRPFGAIDTPTQGGVASGAAFVNFGWALAGQPAASGRQIPIDGSTITVIVDGVAVGHPSYNHVRPDIEGLFPGYYNTTGGRGAIGFRMLDTTTMTNGTHTIAWTVSDNLGAGEGIGSRFFTVSNGSSLVANQGIGEYIGWAAPPPSVQRLASLAADTTSLNVRRGWVLDAAYRSHHVDVDGRILIHSEEVNRVEIAFEPGLGERYSGYLRAGDDLAPLPIGSHLDAATGVFTWAPGVGFVGSYDLVFVRSAGGKPVARHEVRVALHPKRTGATGSQVVIDTPAFQQDVAQPFTLAGWAADLDARAGTGIATLHAWAYPLAGGPPIFLGVARYGGARQDVAAAHGDQFEASGFGVAVQGLTPGNYDLAVFPWSLGRADFLPAKVVRVTVR
jgi:hypothetical protein